jgi:hypothetical protein
MEVAEGCFKVLLRNAPFGTKEISNDVLGQLITGPGTEFWLFPKPKHSKMNGSSMYYHTSFPSQHLTNLQRLVPYFDKFLCF